MRKHQVLTFCHTVRMHKQIGTVFAEMLLVLLPTLLASSLCFELARGFQLRHQLTLSLQAAARVAAVHHAAPQAWQPALHDALSILFVPAGRYVSPQARRDASCQLFKQRFHLPCWQAVELASTHETIHLRLTYLHRPMQEWLRVTLQNVMRLSTRLGQTGESQRSLELQAWRLGLIPMVVEYRVLRHRSTGLREHSASQRGSGFEGSGAAGFAGGFKLDLSSGALTP